VNPKSGFATFKTRFFYVLLGVIVGILIFSSLAFADSPISLVVNGQTIQCSQPPVMINDRTLVPLRDLDNALGAQTAWDGNTQTVTVTSGNTTLSLTIGSTTLTVNGATQQMDVAPIIINGKTFLPASWVAESLSDTVGWDSSSQTVIITGDGSGNSHNSTDNSTNSSNSNQSQQTDNQGIVALPGYLTNADAPAIQSNGIIYLPLRGGADKYNLQPVTWNAATKTIEFPITSTSVQVSNAVGQGDAFIYNGRTYIKESILQQESQTENPILSQAYNNFRTMFSITNVGKPDISNNINITVSYNGDKNTWLSMLKQNTLNYCGTQYCQDIVGSHFP
jgi:hypothetical protein